jgi:rhamnosyltransferase
VIPTRDGAETLGAVLEGLSRQRVSFELEVVVVDSGSRDETLEILAARSLRPHRIPPADFDHGETRNLGIQLAQGDPVVLLTQDAVPADPDLVEQLVRPFADARVAGVYGRQIPRPDCDVVTRRQLEGWLTGRENATLATLHGRQLEELPPFERLELCTFDNVCSALRRGVWEKIPFPRAAFGEDVAWGKAVLQQGWALAYEPRARVVHSHRRSPLYEYSRTRVCHRTLFDLFELVTVPRARHVVRAGFSNLRSDLPYVWHHAPRGTERWRQLARVGALSWVHPLAQHLGFRDAIRARGSASQ